MSLTNRQPIQRKNSLFTINNPWLKTIRFYKTCITNLNSIRTPLFIFLFRDQASVKTYMKEIYYSDQILYAIRSFFKGTQLPKYAQVLVQDKGHYKCNANIISSFSIT